MKWHKMNFRHTGWRAGYRYFATWTARRGLWSGGLGNLVRFLEEEYGPSRHYIPGPPTREDINRYYWTGWHLGSYPNEHWMKDTQRRRIYVTESALLWARLKGRCD